MTLNYKFHNMSQLSNDNYSLTERTKQSKKINNYLTEKYESCSSKALQVALEQPAMLIKGSIGNSGCDVDKFSKLAEPILDHTTKYYSSPANLDKGILDLVKARLEKTKHRLICARCGKWERVFQTNEVKNILVCPYCKARQITAIYYSDYDLPKIIQKKHEGKMLTFSCFVRQRLENTCVQQKRLFHRFHWWPAVVKTFVTAFPPRSI